MVFRIVLFSTCIAATAAQAFSQCATMPLAGPGATLAEEAQNPVQAGAFIYAGYMMKGAIGVATSSDYGKSLGAPVTIFSDSHGVGGLRLGATGRRVYALWDRAVSRGKAELMFDVSNDHGKARSWLPVAHLGIFQRSTLPQFSFDGTNVHVSNVTKDGTIAIRNSTDSGHSFGPSITIGVGAAEIVITSREQNVFVAWNTGPPRSDTIFAASHDGGNTFTVSNMTADRSQSSEPIFWLSPDGKRLNLVWRDWTPVQGVYLQSLDNGATWSVPLAIDSPSRQFMVADDGTYIWISYLKFISAGGKTEIHALLTRSIDGGKSFPPAKDLTGDTGLTALVNDDQRPIPWVGGDRLFRLTAVKADGVHAWSGNNGRVLGSVYLGPGGRAAIAYNSVLWLDPTKVVMYGYCH
jgi:hypothetical protein